LIPLERHTKGVLGSEREKRANNLIQASALITVCEYWLCIGAKAGLVSLFDLSKTKRGELEIVNST
jgi:hypothetical protein